MPTIYLSPSTQQYNPYYGGGTEEYYMNLIADAMVPYLNATGIGYNRNTPEMTAASSITASNSGNYDFHLALHSNASPEATAGSKRGSEVYYAQNSRNGIRAAEIFANNLKLIYPLPDLVRVVPTTSLGEVTRTRAPAVLIEYAYHDNSEDAAWIKNNINSIAENTVLSLADYFGIPFNVPQKTYNAVVRTKDGSPLNMRTLPDVNSPLVGQIPNGSSVVIYNAIPSWCLVRYNNLTGYVWDEYLAAK